MTLREDALATLRRWRPPTAAQQVLRDTFVRHVAEHADALWKAGHLDHLTASGLVISEDRSRVLLTLHRKANRWFQFGGHLEPDDETLPGAALREASEESGVDGLRLDPVPLQLDVHDVPFCRPGARHLDVRFLLRAPADAEPTASEESLDVRWWPVEELPDESLAELVRLGASR